MNESLRDDVSEFWHPIFDTIVLLHPMQLCDGDSGDDDLAIVIDAVFCCAYILADLRVFAISAIAALRFLCISSSSSSSSSVCEDDNAPTLASCTELSCRLMRFLLKPPWYPFDDDDSPVVFVRAA